jgi:hypothetical protein
MRIFWRQAVFWGWRKWVDSKIVDSNVGFVADRSFQPKERNELDDTDSDSWPLNTRGERNDPWQYGYYLRLSDEDGGDVYAWAATSDGARKAIGALTTAYNNHRHRGLGGLPVVKLGTSSYKHRQYGKVDKPVIEVVAWTVDAPTTPAIAPPAIAAPAPKAGPPAADTKAAPSQHACPREFAPVEVYDEDSFE